MKKKINEKINKIQTHEKKMNIHREVVLIFCFFFKSEDKVRLKKKLKKKKKKSQPKNQLKILFPCFRLSEVLFVECFYG